MIEVFCNFISEIYSFHVITLTSLVTLGIVIVEI